MNGLGTKFIPGAEGHPPLKSYLKNVQVFLHGDTEKGRRMSYDFYKISNADLEKYLSDEG